MTAYVTTKYIGNSNGRLLQTEENLIWKATSNYINLQVDNGFAYNRFNSLLCQNLSQNIGCIHKKFGRSYLGTFAELCRK